MTEENYKGYRIRIEQDEDAQDPRKTFDTFGVMACRHDRYDLGDEKAPWATEKEAEAYFESIGAVWLPLYLFDHSGLTMSTCAQTFRVWDSHGWDWGLVGFIYATKEKVLKEYGKKRMSKKLREKAEDLLQSEVATYSTYLEGGVVGYIVENVEGELIDSVWGYYELEHCQEEAKGAVDYRIAQDTKEVQMDRVLEIGEDF